jgi:hypothetical protein
MKKEDKLAVGHLSIKGTFGTVFVPVFRANLIFFFVKIECDLYFLDRFDVLMSKIIFKK